MSLKNYYTILGVAHSASAEDIRNAFRQLAKRYHPDKAPDNPFAETHFREIQEAYEVLSDPERRSKYDEELWLRGLTNRSRTAIVITPDWLLGEAIKLQRHMETIDSYRMNHAALRDYVDALLSDEHLSVLQHFPQQRLALLESLFQSMTRLRLPYLRDLMPRLLLLAGDEPDRAMRVVAYVHTRQRDADWDRRRPWIVIGFALLICLVIWILR